MIALHDTPIPIRVKSEQERMIEDHEKMICIIQLIGSAERKINTRNEMIKPEMIWSNFPDLINKYKNDIDTLQRAVKRLKAYHDRLTKKIEFSHPG